MHIARSTSGRTTNNEMQREKIALIGDFLVDRDDFVADRRPRPSKPESEQQVVRRHQTRINGSTIPPHFYVLFRPFFSFFYTSIHVTREFFLVYSDILHVPVHYRNQWLLHVYLQDYSKLDRLSVGL